MLVDLLATIEYWLDWHELDGDEVPVVAALAHVDAGLRCTCCAVYYGPGDAAACGECHLERAARVEVCGACGSQATEAV